MMSLKKQEYFARVDAVFTGFFKSAEQVDVAEKAVRIAKEANPNVSTHAQKNIYTHMCVYDTKHTQ